MTLIRLFAACTLLSLSACATQPMTFEERINSKFALANDVGGDKWKEEMAYRVGFQYANAARNKTSNPTLQTVRSTDSTLEVPLAIWDYSLRDDYGDQFGNWATSFALSFGTGTSKQRRIGRYYTNGLGFMVNPNTHYFLFDEGSATANDQDVDAAWDAAYALFSAVQNKEGDCIVARWDPAYGYARAQPKNVRGIYKRVVYFCEHPLARDEKQHVWVSAWANPFEGVRSMGAVQTQCWYIDPDGADFVDVRGCGRELALSQRNDIPRSSYEVMELFTTPTAADPSLFEVVSVFKGVTQTLPAPEPTLEYVEYLSARPYTVND